MSKIVQSGGSIPLFRMMEQTFKVARFVEEIEKKPCHI